MRKGELMDKIGEMRFCLDDYRPQEFNESVDCTFSIWGNEDTDVMSIENYHYLCKKFALTMDFTEDTVDKWFGRY